MHKCIAIVLYENPLLSGVCSFPQQVTKELVTFEELGGAMTHTKKSGDLFENSSITLENICMYPEIMYQP